eukprot:TRINITY_DN7056_c0_g1_i1.p1 TRINITY_DN7056_c0_g1~~TRINITY_DN7056_c0_g1_i1.p1  ORF type:complete len:293 (+),score=63.23 TRINITY_DN7056_c0_g1_i1:60-881(+)
MSGLSTLSIAERLKQVTEKGSAGVNDSPTPSPSPSPSPVPATGLVPLVPSVPSAPPSVSSTPSPAPVPVPAPVPTPEAPSGGIGAFGLGGFGLPTAVVTTKVSKGSGGLPGGPSRKEKIGNKPEKGTFNAKCLRQGGDGKIWEDPSMADWPVNDFRLFIGNLGSEVTTETLAKNFAKYHSFLKAKVVRDSHTLKSKGYGFVSFKMPEDGVKAMREMEGKHVGTRPITIKKGKWHGTQAQDTKAASRQLLSQRNKRNQKYHFGYVPESEAFKPF